jgi:hypothetical protein
LALDLLFFLLVLLREQGLDPELFEPPFEALVLLEEVAKSLVGFNQLLLEWVVMIAHLEASLQEKWTRRGSAYWWMGGLLETRECFWFTKGSGRIPSALGAINTLSIPILGAALDRPDRGMTGGGRNVPSSELDSEG